MDNLNKGVSQLKRVNARLVKMNNELLKEIEINQREIVLKEKKYG